MLRKLSTSLKPFKPLRLFSLFVAIATDKRIKQVYNGYNKEKEALTEALKSVIINYVLKDR